MSSATQALPIPRMSVAMVLRDYSEFIKLRVTTLILMTAWCGYYFGAAKSGIGSVSWGLLHAIVGIGLVSAGTAALNEVMERNVDGLMRRTAMRPLVTGHMSFAQGLAAGLMMVLGGTAYLALNTNLLAALLTLATCVVYLGAYTPLKRVSPICTFVGAFPGAMPPVLGWVAARGRLDWEALVLFAILFFWQFPHFHSIAWLYREDYARAGVRMLPVVESDGKSTARQIVFYSFALIPATLAPSLLGMSGKIYFTGALVLGAAFLWSALRLARSRMSPEMGKSKRLARNVLQASVFYLPLLFALMMINAAAS
ncbi:MAG: heme o synthase [Terriglobales bacterium]